jgi:uncharacterized GH25 family protein
MKKYGFLTVLTLIVFCMTAAAAQAHMLWLSPDKTTPAPGETVEITIGFGHHFPHGKMEKQGRLKAVYAVAPDGSKVQCKAQSPAAYTFTPKQEGTYWLFAAMKPGFVSNTTQGRSLGNKKTLENVVSCSAFRLSAMTAVRCGKADWKAAGTDAFDLKLMPVSDPADLKKGDAIALQVLFQGEPLAGASITPSTAVHSHNEDGGHGHHGASGEVETNADGIARVELDSDGAWMFTARHERPYPEKELCDTYSYCTTLRLDL